MPSATFDPQVIAQLDKSIEEEAQKGDAKVSKRESASRRIRMIMQGTARRLDLDGEVKMFGSFSNGFKTGSSDLDVVFVGKVGPDNTISVLGKFAAMAENFGFENVTKIFSANVPLVKFTDRLSGMEVDFCINNELGVRNSHLLNSYCRYDQRVLQLGRLVKDWAKQHELVGTADGCLNSYAYMLLVIHFLQNIQPPVVPNLQMLATEPVKVVDNKWGGEDYWDTKFEDDVKSLPPSTNTMSVGELLVGFFHFFTNVFKWNLHAVCMRLNGPGVCIDKYALCTGTNEDQWYVEDPFDLKHNLGGKCTRAGKKRILDEMGETLQVLTKSGTWSQACPTNKVESFFLKCRVSQGVTPQALLEEFEEFDLIKLHFPKSDDNGRRMGQAFLEFSSAMARRRAHTRNESYVADCQLQLHYSSQHSLAEAVAQGNFSTYEMDSYKMQRKVLQARLDQMPTQQQQQQQQSQSQQRQDLGRAPLGFQDGEGVMQSLMAGDPTGFAFFGMTGMMTPRPPRQQQVVPSQSQPDVWGWGEPGGRWDAASAPRQASASEVSQQLQQLQPQQQPPKRTVGLAEQPAQVGPKAAGLVPSSGNAQRGDAKAKASEQRTSQIRNMPLRAVQPTAASVARPKTADQWLKVPVTADLPMSCVKLLTDDLQAVLSKWDFSKVPADLKVGTEGTIQVELKAPQPDEPPPLRDRKSVV